MLQAKALYDNHSESCEELSFRSGDILSIVEKNVNGLEGWWLCYHGNKLGIAPGNRLKVLKRYPATEDKDKTLTRDDSSRQCNNYNLPASLNDNKLNQGNDLYDSPSSSEKRNYPHSATKLSNSSNATGSHTASSCGSNSPNRSSLLSMLSTGSSSLSDSARSSADVSFSTYDMLPSCNSANKIQKCLFKREENTHTNKSRCNVNKSAASVVSSSDDQRDSYLEDYSFPRNASCDNAQNDNNNSSNDNEFVNVADSRAFFEDLYDSPRRCLNANASAASLSSPEKQPLTMLPSSSSFDDSTLKGYNKQVIDQLYDVPQSLINQHQSNSLNSTLLIKNDSDEIVLNDYKIQKDIELDNQSRVESSHDNSQPVIKQQSQADKHQIGKVSVPVNVLPMMSLHEDIKKYNQKLRGFVLEMGDPKADDLEPDKATLKMSQIKLCCLSLKSALKELVDFASNSKFPQVDGGLVMDNNSNLESIKNKIEVLKCSLKEFEEKTNELHISNTKRNGNNTTSNKKLVNIDFLQLLLNAANKLPLASNMLISDICSYFNVNDNNHIVTASCVDEQSPSKPMLPARSTSAMQAHQQTSLNAAAAAKKSIQSRPLPAPPLNNFRLASPHRPQEQIHYRYHLPEHNNFSGSNVMNGSASPRSTLQHQVQHQHSTPSYAPQPQSNLLLQRQHTLPNSQSQFYQQQSQQQSQQCDPMVGSDESDSLLVAFYASQIQMHFNLVKTSATKFCKTMFSSSAKRQLQPIQLLPTPKEFVLRSKFVILAAHKLVYVADAIARNLADPTRYIDIAESANKLCNALKIAVNSTKESALQHEDVEKRDCMVKSILSVEAASDELCSVISKYKRCLDSNDEEEEVEQTK
ncbi:hypothetical protein HELRODRAFT_191215 [Helobdella robusta]|uniref:SH3 domain-containing protein n=1 Tax=Helobdella robusta TaxID=6412 RepID=T1FSR0_HELRO|nr:hypothetical protein HELRODRAFT_191215 [Helobdella robusta]ESO06866.1 hypothetical protein HELRODRAFT_191215 [Helobdella robusta]